jgi:hypothetical protein
MFNRNEDRGYTLGGKGGRCVRPTTLPPSCTGRLEFCELQPPEAIRSRPGLEQNDFTFLRLCFHLCQHQPNYFFPPGFPMTIIYTFLPVLDPFYLLWPDHPDAIFGKNTTFHILIIQLSQASFSSVTFISGPPAERQTSFTHMPSSR